MNLLDFIYKIVIICPICIFAFAVIAVASFTPQLAVFLATIAFIIVAPIAFGLIKVICFKWLKMFFINLFLVLILMSLTFLAIIMDPIGMWTIFKNMTIASLIFFVLCIIVGAIMGLKQGLQEYKKAKDLSI